MGPSLLSQPAPAAVGHAIPLGVAIFNQSNVMLSRGTLDHGWNPITRLKSGIHVFDVGLVIWNACPGAGELNIDRIEITFDRPPTGILPCANWTVVGNKLIIGAGHEGFLPRASLRVRWDYSAVAPTSVPYGPATVHWAASQHRDIFTPLKNGLPHPRPTGMWPVYGEQQVAPPGADDRDAVAGWEQDGAGLLLRSDMTMNRMPIGCLDQHTGEPIVLHDPTYTLDATPNAQLVQFSRAFSVSDPTRAPRVTVPGTCSYFSFMRTNEPAFNGQHRGNATSRVRGAAQCGDPIAQFDLRVLANDAAMAKSDASSNPFGGRDRAWRIDALAHAPEFWELGRTMSNENVAAQTQSGGILRAPAGYGFNPSPQSYGMPADFDSDQLMERDLTCYAAGLYGQIDLIRRAIIGQPWPAPKFVGVGRNQTEIFDTYQHPCGPGDYYGDIALGVWAVLDPHDVEWQLFALKQPVPGWTPPLVWASWHGYTSLKQRRDLMRAATLGREQSAMLLSVLEGMAL